jgi:hypothetical protein
LAAAGVLARARFIAVEAYVTRFAITATIGTTPPVVMARQPVAIDVASVAVPVFAAVAEPSVADTCIALAVAVVLGIAFIHRVAQAVPITAEAVVAYHVPRAHIADSLAFWTEVTGTQSSAPV